MEKPTTIEKSTTAQNSGKDSSSDTRMNSKTQKLNFVLMNLINDNSKTTPEIPTASQGSKTTTSAKHSARKLHSNFLCLNEANKKTRGGLLPPQLHGGRNSPFRQGQSAKVQPSSVQHHHTRGKVDLNAFLPKSQEEEHP